MKFKKTPENVARLLFWSGLGLVMAVGVIAGMIIAFPMSVEHLVILGFICFVFAFDRVQVIAEGG